MSINNIFGNVVRWDDTPLGKAFANFDEQFKSGLILNATREELEHYLVMLVNCSTSLKPETIEPYVTVVRELIQLRITKEAADKSSESNRKSRKIAVLAVCISGLSVVATLAIAMLKKTVINIPVPSVTVQAPAVNNITTNIITVVTTNKP